jgi:hypothetical protein
MNFNTYQPNPKLGIYITKKLPTIYTRKADLEESTLATTVQEKRLIATEDKGMIFDAVFNDKNIKRGTFIEKSEKKHNCYCSDILIFFNCKIRKIKTQFFNKREGILRYDKRYLRTTFLTDVGHTVKKNEVLPS